MKAYVPRHEYLGLNDPKALIKYARKENLYPAEPQLVERFNTLNQFLFEKHYQLEYTQNLLDLSYREFFNWCMEKKVDTILLGSFPYFKDTYERIEAALKRLEREKDLEEFKSEIKKSKDFRLTYLSPSINFSTSPFTSLKSQIGLIARESTIDVECCSKPFFSINFRIDEFPEILFLDPKIGAVGETREVIFRKDNETSISFMFTHKEEEA